jgi:mRNA (guanine-N(7))-methyltransferase domain
MKSIKRIVYDLMMNTKTGKFVVSKIINNSFKGSATYWEERYRKNGNSGKGSYGENAVYKAGFINALVAQNNIQKVIEMGCGDGNQLKQFRFLSYIGLDISPTAIKKCKELFNADSNKTFYVSDEKTNTGYSAELALSLDVIYHLVEDEIFETYMRCLFLSSTRFVIIYAWDEESPQNLHVRHRKFTKWIDNNLADWQLIQIIPNENAYTACDFYIYEKR